jgi:hypothetical protein
MVSLDLMIFDWNLAFLRWVEKSMVQEEGLVFF